MDEELAGQYLPTARAAADAMTAAGTAIVYYADEMLKQAAAAVALARTTAANYAGTEDGNRAAFDGLAGDPDYSTGADPTAPNATA